jgi:hypothetical protein
MKQPTERKRGSVDIGEDFPIREAKEQPSYSDARARYWIALCVLTTFFGIGLGGAISSLHSGDHTAFQAVFSSMQPFVGILIGYYFGRHGQGGRDDKKDDESSA